MLHPAPTGEQVLQAVKGFPAVVLTGPRRAGKTLLLRRLFTKASYFLLEDPDVEEANLSSTEMTQ